MSYDYYIGLSLGAIHDWTALAVMEEPVWIPSGVPLDRQALVPAAARGWVGLDLLTAPQVAHWRYANRWQGRPPDPPLYLRHLERMRDTSYQQILDRVGAILAAHPLVLLDVALLVDCTEVGRTVLDRLRIAGLPGVGVTLTAGDQVYADLPGGALRVPKRELILATQVLLQGERLRVAAALEHAATFTEELLAYRAKPLASERDLYSAREGQHDDLLLAVGLAAWFRTWFNHHLDVGHGTAAGPG